ncbi:tetratricopeptide repeat protein 1-like [Rhopilema esculentum]|uniref:tetratricopeptide repeat protein 1-like n=1 Tax=Rhopilema esculentum TaxID=499914 RepID=UPI0031E08198|eukprot:gene11911-2477_t
MSETDTITPQNESPEKQYEDKKQESAESKENVTEEDEVEEILSTGVKQERLEEANNLKAKGNSQFINGEYETAMDIYTDALKICPKDCTKQLSVLFANRAACYVKMGESLSAIHDCTSALELDKCYIKARLRRAQAYEAQEKLEDAFEDYKKVLELDRSCTVAGEAVKRLPDQINARNEKLKEEMFGKLKELGNMVLGPFGLSTDNFKVQQDPSSGGYSINFQK